MFGVPAVNFMWYSAVRWEQETCVSGACMYEWWDRSRTGRAHDTHVHRLHCSLTSVKSDTKGQSWSHQRALRTMVTQLHAWFWIGPVVLPPNSGHGQRHLESGKNKKRKALQTCHHHILTLRAEELPNN